MITIAAYLLIVFNAVILLRIIQLAHKQRKSTKLLEDYCMMIFAFTKYHTHSNQLVLWKCMNDMYIMQARAVERENYEMAEQYKIAIESIEAMMNYYRNNLEDNDNEKD